MTWAERFKAAEPYIIGIGLPLAVLVTAVEGPVLYDHGSRLAEISGQIDKQNQHVDDKLDGLEKLNSQQFADLGQKLLDLSKNIDSKFGQITDTIARDEGSIADATKRLDQQETDPGKLLSLIGLKDPQRPLDVVGFMYRGYIYIIPRTEAAYALLVYNGLPQERLSPTISAFKVTVKGAPPDQQSPGQQPSVTQPNGK